MKLPIYHRLLIWLLAATLLTSVVFVAFPVLDIMASNLFYNGGFWLHDIPLLQALRLALIWGMYGFVLFVLAVFLIRLKRGQSLRAWSFSLAVILVGPLGLVNGVLKTYWGRARPSDITLFGGDKSFTPAWFYADQCDFNCSFTSGEGGAIATTALLIGFLAWPKLGPLGRRWLGVALVALVGLTAGLRVLVGQHFLSDTLLSILLCALVAVLIYPLFFPDKSKHYAIAYQRTRARHPAIGAPIELSVPLAATHRPAVKAFLQGKYFEAFSHRAFKDILAYRKGNAVHAGAFFGDMLHTLSQFADTVYAFEPVLDNYILAKKNIADLRLKNVSLLNAALGAAQGFADMKTYTENGDFRGGGASIIRRKFDAALLEHVPIFALDALGLNNVALLHLDVEGYEFEVLKGASALIKESKPIILLEDTPQKCAAILEPLGYTLAFRRASLDYWVMPADMAFISSLKAG
jgi:FkbM family methyltransferase